MPSLITVGARDTQAPRAKNAAFAAERIPGAELVAIPADVDHEVLVNECDERPATSFPKLASTRPASTAMQSTRAWAMRP
ncbi:hypothetical protein [Methyloceanibacter sp.]|uniref:hypothetical protein n=1 Tax=Methyloceanibacter sp. TaxID=1965321 RepID=UPI002D3D919C|nr:hypothetical protein [Methyloceanibacter sp.]HZP07827.1 hypothetical protein [Methyloceanibacter sp.]